MSRPQQEKGKPFSIRLTEGEKDTLRNNAAGRPLGIYIREALLNVAPRPNRRQSPVQDGKPLGRILGLLGQTRLASNLNQIAKAANQGSLPVTQELEEDLRRACADISDIRQLLLKALGMTIMDEINGSTLRLAGIFAKEASGSPRE